MTLLVGDIGGTNARFAIAPEGSVRPRDVAVEAGDGHATFAQALGAYLQRLADRPRRAAFAVAGPVSGGGYARITNRPSWEIDAAALRAAFGFDEVVIVNDFVAQAHALPHLDPSELFAIGPAKPGLGVKVAVGPGTGLGVAALAPRGDGWTAFESEGGHVDLGPIDDREAAALDRIRRGGTRLSAENALSGPGLVRLHAALSAATRETAAASPAEIVAAAEAGDPRSGEAVRLFLRLLARFAGDVALTFKAEGGVYLCGGVTPRLLRLIDQSDFRAAFEDKDPHRALMRGIATAVAISPVAGLIGCAAAADSVKLRASQ